MKVMMMKEMDKRISDKQSEMSKHHTGKLVRLLSLQLLLLLLLLHSRRCCRR